MVEAGREEGEGGVRGQGMSVKWSESRKQRQTGRREGIVESKGIVGGLWGLSQLDRSVDNLFSQRGCIVS